MRLMMAWLQHLLIVLPAVANFYVASISSPAAYVGCVLLALFAIRLMEFKRDAAIALLPISIAGYGWMANEYGGVMFFLFYSGLVSAFIYFRRPALIAIMSLLTLVVLNAGAADHGLTHAWTINLTWGAMALLLTAAAATERKKAALEGLYDAMTHNHEALEQERRRTREFARKVEDYAQVEERSRIATELHDDLGHRLIRVKMMTEATLQLLEREPDKARAMLEQVRDQMEMSMDNMRRTVRKLRPAEENAARKYALNRLIEDAGRDLGIAVTLDIAGRPKPLYPSVEYVLYRNAQEAITNAVRHGGATAVEVELRFEPDALAMRVANNGSLPGDITSGLGLNGMRERIAMLGGKLVLSADGRFAITTLLPYNENGQQTPDSNLTPGTDH